jgi:hypothetical protein
VVLQAEDAPAGGRPKAQGSEVDSGRASLRRAWRPHPYHSCCRTPVIESAEVKGTAVSVVDRDRPVASCSKWHGDGTASEDNRASHLIVKAPARPEGEARPGQPFALLASAQRARGSSPVGSADKRGGITSPRYFVQ